MCVCVCVCVCVCACVLYACFLSLHAEMYLETDISPDTKRRSVTSEDSTDAPKAHQMYMWNDECDSWRRCSVSFHPPCLHINEYDDAGVMQVLYKWTNGCLLYEKFKLYFVPIFRHLGYEKTAAAFTRKVRRGLPLPVFWE